MNKKIDKILFIPISKLQGKHFLVKDYQRGYKWEKEQIEALLNDINNHKNGKYCLQPIIVEEREEGIELIDGQQRMTTIYLLLHFLKDLKYFTIDYQTRKASQHFLAEKVDSMFDAVYKEKKWETFILEFEKQTELNYNNVDIFHFYLVTFEIFKWFNDKSDDFKLDFKSKLLQQVNVIWYDIKSNSKSLYAEDVFLNLNAGKIPLTNSELIKALFILDVQNRHSKDIARLKAAELATEWDAIENQLHEPDFWYFICDHSYYFNLDTRIDFIIDLTNGITPKKDWDGMNSYRYYESQFGQNPLNWEKIKQTFNKLNEWYKDKELYHYVGYLVVTKIKRLSEIIKFSIGKSKTIFKKELIDLIKLEFKRTKNIEDKKRNIYDLETINYKDNRDECENLLLLLNVQYFLNNSSSNKFPFDLYRKEFWSVEHINPQNPKNFKSIKEIDKWLTSFKKYYNRNKIEGFELVAEISEILNILPAERHERKLSELKWNQDRITKFQNVIDKITENLELHGIANLSLLDRDTNSKLGNNIFIDKRKVILDLYYSKKDENVFIPECTKDVFTKNFSKESENIVDEVFGLKDMEDYKEHIKSQLALYYEK